MTSFIVSCPCPCGHRFPVDSETMRTVQSAFNEGDMGPIEDAVVSLGRTIIKRWVGWTHVLMPGTRHIARPR